MEKRAMEQQTTPEVNFKEFLIPADLNKIRCVDERHASNQTSGIQIQGATSGIIDALKIARPPISEESAWKLVRDCGIPVDGHDDTHHGQNGCGYNNRVEKDPSTVDAPEVVTAASRLSRVQPERILHYEGDHNPKFATINFVPNTTIDTNGILSAGKGTFNLDAWALLSIAAKLGLTHDESARFVTHIVDSYKQTVLTLTNSAISSFVELH